MPKNWSDNGLTVTDVERIERDFRVPVDTLFGPDRRPWILALARESLLPDDRSLQILRDATEWQVNAFFGDRYAASILTNALPFDGGWNTMTLYLDEDGWHGRRSTWREGFPYWPAAGMNGRAPGGSLIETLEFMLVGDTGSRKSAWREHLKERVDLYGDEGRV